MTRFRYGGEDMMPRVRQWLVDQVEAERDNPGEKAKPRYNNSYALQLFDLYGALPTAPSHTKEYVPFFQGYGVAPNYPEPIRLFDADLRAREMAEAWQVTQKYASDELSVQQFLESGTKLFGKARRDHCSDIIESMWGGLGKQFYINTPNGGAIANLPNDAVLELRCDIDMRGHRPQPFGSFPRGLLALQHQVLDTHELTVEAAITGDRAILRRAMLTDPICNNIGDADNCICELLEAERDALPSYWFE
jgi:alpha-galactosidase